MLPIVCIFKTCKILLYKTRNQVLFQRLFEFIEPIKNQKVKLTNDKLAEIKGKGTAIII